MEVYYFNTDTKTVDVFKCHKVVAGIENCTAVNTTTGEMRHIKYINLLYVVIE